jgi:hypothetical protein
MVSSPPFLLMMLDSGSVMTKEKPGSPVREKPAACTVPVVDGSVTPPSSTRVGEKAGGNVTVPGALLTAIFPNFRSPSLIMETGVTILAVADAYSVTWAMLLMQHSPRKTGTMKNFIVFVFYYLNPLLKGSLVRECKYKVILWESNYFYKKNQNCIRHVTIGNKPMLK